MEDVNSARKASLQSINIRNRNKEIKQCDKQLNKHIHGHTKHYTKKNEDRMPVKQIDRQRYTKTDR